MTIGRSRSAQALTGSQVVADGVLIKSITAHQDVTHFTGMTRSFATLVLCLQDAR
jgi:hypothetical protein